MPKKYSKKFWISFWLISAVFLLGWFVFLQYKSKGYLGLISFFRPAAKILPIDQKQKEELGVVFDIIDKLADSEEKTFLILFQNNNELRPGGGYIGSFGILKIKDKKITFVDSHDTNIFDDRASTEIEPPFPMKKMLRIPDWELRDSNWSPDFPTNAKKAEEFFHLEGGQEQFDGVIAISTALLPSFLEITGPVSVEGYPGEYNSENAITKLQYQVERGYKDQDIEKGKRKYIMKDLSKKIMDRTQAMSFLDKKKLAERVEQHLDEKDILIYFKDEELQEKIRTLGWSGEVQDSESDYLMIVDANMGSLKSDAVIDRSVEYTVDFQEDMPKATLKITYQHNGKSRDWKTKDYDTYTRVYVPKESWLHNATGVGKTRFGEELDKKYFGFLHQVKLGETKTVVVNYDLPENITEENYSLLVQKQAGLKNLPLKSIIIKKGGERVEKNIIIKNSEAIGG